MGRGLLCNVLDRDLACAVALSFVDLPRVAVNAQTITIHDANMRLIGSVPDWLDGGDPLDAATRDYLQARQEATLSGPKPGAKPWEASARTKAREVANQRAIQAKARGKALLEERGVLAQARAQGLRVAE
jgi:hypothetical protein